MNTDNRNGGVNFNEQQPFVVGILSPSTTLYIDHQLPPEVVIPPTDLDLRRRNTNSFQITSVTVQAGPGTRKGGTGNQNNNNNGGHPNNHADDFYDSADDLDESRTDDLSSDFLDSSRADGGGYQSEDIGDDLLSSPCCGPIVFAQVPTPGAGVDPNANGTSLGVTPTYTGVVAGGVTMMTSKSESPISAQVPVMNPLPDNWQRRFKVVKIVSSEPFKRGRWLCMDFKDPPANVEGGGGETEIGNGGGTRTPPPTIHITGCGDGGPGLGPTAREEEIGFSSGCGDFAQVYEIPINQTFSGNFVMGNQQQMYGIILPQTSHLQPVTLVQDMSLLQTLPMSMDANFNNLVNNNCNIHVVQEPGSLPESAYHHQHHAATLRQVQTLVNNNNVQPSSLSANNNNNNNNNYVSAPPQAVLNHVVVNSVAASVTGGRDSPDIVMRTMSLEENSAHRVPGSSSVSILPPLRVEDVEAENTESFSSLANELSRASGASPRRSPPTDFGSNGLCRSPPMQPRILPPVKPLVVPPQTVVAAGNIVPSVVAPPTAVTLPETNSSQTAPEKIPPSEVGHEVDPSAGSAASTGGNTVAIDNKIEQAMDLVKSHLMFAVREEVEVLKEKITELLERISQLEHENDILRANASAETLKQLSNQSQKKNGGGTTGKPQAVAPIPPST